MRWFYRFTALHFIVTAVTGIALYFRPGGARPALYSDRAKEWLVMVHNSEWISYVLFGNPFVSGIAVGSALALALVRFSLRSLRQGTRTPPRVTVDDSSVAPHDSAKVAVPVNVTSKR
jgi:hypothetical protein